VRVFLDHYRYFFIRLYVDTFCALLVVMAPSTSLLAATKASRDSVLDGFKSHSSGLRVDTNTAVLGMLRKEYADYHVTEVDAKEAALFEYAAAGKATLVLDAEDETFHAKRSWRSVGEGVDKKMHPGNLNDTFRFAR
jgi:transitional endoplasmic reticulum ATPase